MSQVLISITINPIGCSNGHPYIYLQGLVKYLYIDASEFNLLAPKLTTAITGMNYCRYYLVNRRE